MKKFLLFCLAVALCASCKGDDGWSGRDFESLLTFTKAEMTVAANDENGFAVPAKLLTPWEKELGYGIKVNEQESTAIPGTHFVIPDKLIYEFPANTTDEQLIDFELIPENITEEVVLVLEASYHITGSYENKLIQKMTIHILPAEE
jgi:hypothetical protein